MRIVNVTQGTPEWHEFRANHQNASEAAAVFGDHKYMSRDDLLHEKATGERPDVSPAQQRLYDSGHQAEASARPIAERIIGEELYPCCVEDDEGWLGASMDGLTMLGDTAFEHKLYSVSLAEQIRNQDIAEHYKWQMDQQMLVSGAERVLFMCSDGTEDKCEWMWYERDESRLQKLAPAWRQFEKDLAEHQPREKQQAPEPEAGEQFPTLYLEIHGGVDNSNLPAFVDQATQYLESINTDLQTDQDFATAEQAAKDLGQAEKQIELVKSQALAQTTSIEEAFREMDRIKESCRSKRLTLEKLVKSEKEARKGAIIQEAQDAFMAELEKANEEFRPVCIDGITADFRGAVKGKRTLDSIQSACNDELARAKIALTEKRDHIRESLRIIDEAAGEYRHLFHDAQQLVDKDHEHLKLLVRQRVDEHKAAEQKRIDMEAERRAEQKRQQEEREQAAKAKAAGEPEKPQESHKAEPSNDADPQPKSEPAAQKPAGRSRPSDDEIIEVLALHFRVHESKVWEWLTDMDLNAAGEKLASNF